MTINASDFNAALEEIEASKGITKETVLSALEEALIKGYRKQLGGDDADVRVNIDADNGIIEMWQVKIVRDDVQDDFLEISTEDANATDKKANYVDGDEFFIPASIEDLRKATAMSIKSIMRQKFAEAEKGILYEVFKDKIGTLVTGKVEKVDERGITVNLVRTSVYLPSSQLIGDEKFNVGDQIKVYIHDVASGTKGAHIVVSRSNEGFLRCILNEEVPDIYNGVVVIKAIAREAGERSKIAVYSPDPNVDPAGACIGPNGTKIQKVVGQLGNGQSKEKIDVITYSDNPGLFIIDALKPARVAGIVVDVETKSATAIVKDDSFSLAIGRKGANVRLAVKLTGYHIDIKVESEAIEEGLSYQTIEELVASELEIKNKLQMELAAQKAAEFAAATAARVESEKPTPTVLPGLPEGYVAPQDRVYEDTNEDLNEALEEQADDEVVADTPASNTTDVKENKDEEKVEVKEEKITNVKTTTSLADLEASLENDKSSKKSFTKKKSSNKKKEEEENKDDKKGVTDTSSGERMSIYTEEELAELDAEEVNDEYEDEEEVDYDEYDDYYDEDNR